MSPSDAYPFTLLALCLWREARGELYDTKVCVAWSIRNRVQKPGWWGSSWETVVLMPFQYSSFNHGDPNAAKLPHSSDPTFQDCLAIAGKLYAEPPTIPDPTGGATSYFDMSLDTDPPKWATDGSQVKTLDMGRLHFYRVA